MLQQKVPYRRNAEIVENLEFAPDLFKGIMEDLEHK